MSLEDSVRTWLDGQGYPLEMRVAETLRRLDIGADHGRVYTDPVTNKVREIDLVGYMDHGDRDAGFSIHLVFECKHSDKPWILFCTERPKLTLRGYVLTYAGTSGAEKAMQSVQSSELVQHMRLFNRPRLAGFNFVRAFNTEGHQDAAFQAIRGTVAACISTADALGKWGHNILYIPIVVTDSPLLQCYLPAGDESYSLEEITEGSVLYNTGIAGDVGRSNLLTVHILHMDALPSFLDTVKKEMTHLYPLVRPALHKRSASGQP